MTKKEEFYKKYHHSGILIKYDADKLWQWIEAYGEDARIEENRYHIKKSNERCDEQGWIEEIKKLLRKNYENRIKELVKK
jgi:hypothetical protein